MRVYFILLYVCQQKQNFIFASGRRAVRHGRACHDGSRCRQEEIKKTKTYKYYENIFSINYGMSDGRNVCLCARCSRFGML